MKFPARNYLGLQNKITKFIFTVGFFIFLVFGSTGSVNAESYTIEKDYNTQDTTAYSNINDDVQLNTHNGIQILFIEFLSTIQCQLTGEDPLRNGGKCLGVDPESGKIGFVDGGGGAIVAAGKLIDTTLVPPASGFQYLTYLQQNFGIVKSSYAQSTDPVLVGESWCLSQYQNRRNGIGFCQIEFLLPIWEVMRNIVYLLFILIFVVIGLGIMLRVHIDPRTVMTIQNQIPKIIIGIIAVTFSFAIAGFLIDIMWLATYLFASVITSAATVNVPYTEITQATSPFNAANQIWPNSGFGIYEVSRTAGTAFGDVITTLLNDINDDLGLLWDIAGGLLTIIGTIVIFIAIIIALIRLWVKLIFALISIILDVILAPWWILAGLIPGSNLGVGVWLRDIIANLAVFPVTVAFLLLATLIMHELADNSNAAYARTISFPIMGGANANSLAILIGFGFLMFIPGLIDSLKELVKAPKGGFGNIFGPVGSATGYAKNVVGGTASIVGTQGEAVMKQQKSGKYDWEKKGLRGGIKQRMFGR